MVRGVVMGIFSTAAGRGPPRGFGSHGGCAGSELVLLLHLLQETAQVER